MATEGILAIDGDSVYLATDEEGVDTIIENWDSYDAIYVGVPLDSDDDEDSGDD